MRPSRTFLFLLTVVVCLSLLSVFFYPQKWRTAFGLPEQSVDLSKMTDDVVLSSAVKVTDSTFQTVNDSSLFIVDSIEIASGKTKDAVAMFKALNQRDTLFVKTVLDEQTYLAFQNISSTYVIEENELNAYLAANYRSLVIEKAVWENLVGEAK